MDRSSENLLEFLRRHQGDRGIMANLRCALVENKRRRAWPILACHGGIGDDFKALTVQYLAGFFASHPKECHEGNFGHSCFQLMDDEERRALAEGGVGPLSRRFQHLLASEAEEIFGRVMRLLMRCKSKEISINYSQLFQDLSRWQYMPDTIRNNWARSFWAPKAEDNL
jgi:CRISPR system Cascade subunit CasB